MTEPDAPNRGQPTDDDRSLSPQQVRPLRTVFGADLPELVIGFLEDLSSAVPALAEAIDHGNTTLGWEIAHKLGGASGMFGARHLEAAFRRLEDALEAGTGDHRLLLTQVEARAAAIRPALQMLADGAGPPDADLSDRS